MRTHLLLILVLAILTTSGCSVRQGSWWPFSSDQECVECVDYDAASWTGVEPNFPQKTRFPKRTGSRLAFLNPFKWGRSENFQYEGEIIASGCTNCGTEGTYPGNGQCDNCLQETVSQVLDTNSTVENSIEGFQEPGVFSAPASQGSSVPSTLEIPAAPNMGMTAPTKVVQPHSALNDHLPHVEADSTLQSQQFTPVQKDMVGAFSPAVETPIQEAAPGIPTTVMNDGRVKFRTFSENSGDLSGHDSTRPARIVNQFNDNVDWSNVPKPKSIALTESNKTGSEPSVQVKSYGNKGRIIEFAKPPQESQSQAQLIQPQPIQPPQIEVQAVGTPPQNPKFEQFNLKDLFPAEEQVQQPASQNESPLPESIQEPVQQPQQAKSVIESDENIEWGLPNRVPTKGSDANSSGESDDDFQGGELVDVSEWDVKKKEGSDWDEGRGRKSKRDTEEEEDEALYQDEDGDYDQDADFSNPDAYEEDDEKDRYSQRSEKDIIQELRNSTVPNQVVFDNGPQIPEQQSIKLQDEPVVLAARPVPHYQELRHLARMNEDGAIDMSGEDVMIQRLPKISKVQATPVSARREVPATEHFNFQPLPNLMLPTSIELDALDSDLWQNEAFDPDTILNDMLPPLDNHTAAVPRLDHATETPMVDVPPKRNAVPIILRAAPTFSGQNRDSEESPVSSSKARIRFIKPSFQRELIE